MTEPALLRPEHADPVAASAGVVSESEHDVAARRHPPAVHHARPDHRPPRRPGAAGAGRAGPQAVAAGAARAATTQRSRRALRAGLGHRRLRWPRVLPVLPAGQHRRAAAPRRASCVRCGRRTARCAIMQRLAEAFPGSPSEVQRGPRPAGAAAGVHRAPHRVVAAVGAGDPAPGGDGARPTGRTTTELGALVDQLWQTDELRPDKPTVADEARAMGWYMEQLGRGAVPDLLGRARPRGARRRVHPPRRRAAAGAGLLGGRRPRRQPQRHPGRHPRGAGALRRPGAAHPRAACWSSCSSELSISTRVVGVSEELRGVARARPAAAARGLRPPQPAQRARALPAQALLRPGPAGGHPRADRATGAPHRPAATTSARTATSTDLRRPGPLPARPPRRPHRRRHARPRAAHRPRARPAPGRAGHPRAQRQAPRRARPPSTTRSASWTSPTPS